MRSFLLACLVLAFMRIPLLFADWELDYRASDYDLAQTAVKMPGGDFLLGGLSDYRLATFRLSPDGSECNVMRLDLPTSEGIRKLLSLADGGFVGVATIERSGSIITHFASLLRFDASGDTSWTQDYTDGTDCYGQALALTPAGGFLVAGSSRASSGLARIYYFMTDTAGSEIGNWHLDPPGLGQAEIRAAISLRDGGYALAGVVNYQISAHSTGYLYLVRLDASGDTIWTRTYGSEAALSQAFDLLETPEGNIVVAGMLDQRERLGGTGCLLKVTPDGSLIWQRTYPDIYTAAGVALSGTEFLLVGNTWSQAAGAHYYQTDARLLSLDAEGIRQSTRAFGSDLRNDFLWGILTVGESGFLAVGNSIDSLHHCSVFAVCSQSAGVISEVRAEAHSFTASPSPFADFCKIRLPAHADATIHDALGRAVARFATELNGEIWSWRPDGIQPGIYTISVRTPHGESTQRVIYVH